MYKFTCKAENQLNTDAQLKNTSIAGRKHKLKRNASVHRRFGRNNSQSGSGALASNNNFLADLNTDIYPPVRRKIKTVLFCDGIRLHVCVPGTPVQVTIRHQLDGQHIDKPCQAKQQGAMRSLLIRTLDSCWTNAACNNVSLDSLKSHVKQRPLVYLAGSILWIFKKTASFLNQQPLWWSFCGFRFNSSVMLVEDAFHRQ